MTVAEDVRRRYEETPYRQGVHPLTHPARLGAVARLFGVPAAPPERARVLELGCGQGYNLLPIAEAFPRARFVGVDFSGPEIEEGRSVVAAVGLRNVELVHADLLAYEPAPGAFDYVIAHGLFSWVPDAVKDRALALCARALAPHGVAYVSFNALPGWKQREALRDLMLLHAGEGAGHAMAAPARAAAEVLDRALAAYGPTPPYAMHMRREIEALRRKDPNVVLHDELGTINDPCYLMQFAEWAAEHGLAYLGDAELGVTFGEDLPEGVRAPLLAMGLDRLGTEQMFDFAAGTLFRRALLRPVAGAGGDRIDAEALRGCAFATRLTPVVPPGASADTAATRFTFPGHTSPGAVVVEAQTPWAAAALLALDGSRPRRVPWAELAASVGRRLGGPVPETELPALLLELWRKGHMDVQTACGLDCVSATGAPRRPRATPLARHLAAHDLPLGNLWHEPVEPGPDGRRLLARCDGAWDAGATPEEVIRLAEMGLLLPDRAG